MSGQIVGALLGGMHPAAWEALQYSRAKEREISRNIFCAVFLQVSDGDSESTFRPRVKVPLSTREVDNPDEPVLDRA